MKWLPLILNLLVSSAYANVHFSPPPDLILKDNRLGPQIYAWTKDPSLQVSYSAKKNNSELHLENIDQNKFVDGALKMRANAMTMLGFKQFKVETHKLLHFPKTLAFEFTGEYSDLNQKKIYFHEMAIFSTKDYIQLTITAPIKSVVTSYPSEKLLRSLEVQ